MPYKDPEKAREWSRRYYQETIERRREVQRKYEEKRRQDPAHRERKRADSRRRYWADPERSAAQNRAWREANPERVKENMRRWLANGGNPHRRRLEATARLWHEQDGRCYLCERPVPLENVHLDHDHRCCPRLKFCDACIRGAACRGCNHAIGNAEDDPDRLELIARNLRAKLTEVGPRIAAVPVQLSLDDVL